MAWDAQPRGDRSVGLAEAFRRHAGHVILGLAMAAVTLMVGPVLFWWMSPIVLGLVLSPVLTSWSSRRSAGLAARRLRLFLIPAEAGPAPELREMVARTAGGAARTMTRANPRPALPPHSPIPMIPRSLIRRPLDRDTVDAD